MAEKTLTDHIDLIREVFHYTHRFTGTIFVVKVDYTLFDNIYFSLLIKDLAMLHKAGIRIVLVPGAKERIDDVLARYGQTSAKVKGIRISDPETIPFIKMAAFDVSNRLMTMLSGQGITAVAGNWVQARALGVLEGVDYKNTGRVDKINADPVKAILEEGFIPIFPCIGWNHKGQAYNISSNDLAAQVAIHLGAQKLFFLSSENLFLSDLYDLRDLNLVIKDNRISRITLDQVKGFIARNSSKPRVCELLSLAAEACENGVNRVHFVDGRTQGVILKEVFSNQGIGTMVHQDPFERLRPMEREDISEVLRMMEPFVAKGILVPRSEEQMQSLFKDFVVYAVDEAIHACGALHQYGQQGEIAAIAVDSGYSHLGMGQKLVHYLIHKAQEIGLKKVFVLTTQSSDWFLRLGFSLGQVEDIPQERQEKYNPHRNSRIYILDLNDVPVDLMGDS